MMRQLKENYLTKGVTLIFLLTLLAAGLFAGKPKPDLKITRIDTTRDCRLAITVRNIGPGKLPDEVYTNHHPKSAGVRVRIIRDNMYVYNQAIWEVDTERKLQNKGGTVIFIFSQRIYSRVFVDAKVDRYDVVEEAKEHNNTRERDLPACTPGPSLGRSGDPTAVGHMNSISGITFLPESPGQLYPNQKVRLFYHYFTNEKEGVIIMVAPMSQGSAIPGCITPPSLLKPAGKGEDETYFTFGKAPVSVDAVRFRMYDSLGQEVIYEKSVEVKFNFVTTKISAKPPRRVFLDFNNARLAYVPSSKRILIRAGNILLSRCQDWLSVKLAPHLYHLRQKDWQGFFWLVDTKFKNVSRVTNGTFGQISGQHVIIPGISVQVVGGAGGSTPQRFLLRFDKAFLLYMPSLGAVQIITEDSVLSESYDWRDCHMSANTFHVKKTEWAGYFWKISLAEKRAYKIQGGSFCTSGGSASPLPVDVRIFR